MQEYFWGSLEIGDFTKLGYFMENCCFGSKEYLKVGQYKCMAKQKLNGQ